MSDDERAFRSASQALALDANGDEILVGLTREESEWLVQDERGWLEARQSGTRQKADKARYLELRDKHEIARLQAIGLMHAKPHGTA